MTREPQLDYRYSPDEIGELNAIIDEQRAKIERLEAEVSRWKAAYEEARDLARAALEPKP